MVGSEFQAVIPEGLCKYGDALPYENEDKLVWDPFKLQELEVERYEHKSIQLQSSVALAASVPAPTPAAGEPASAIDPLATSTPLSPPPPAAATTTSGSPSTASTTVPSISRLLAQLPVGSHLRDDEHSLYLLLQCGHNVDEALRRRRIAVVHQQTNTQNGCHNATTEPAMSEWSEEECRNFESGLRIYGKDFHTIQLQKVRTRAVGELVQFYYVWKKTQRHDVFANKARLDKKKYSLHPGLTDYMDRFLEEQEFNGSGGGGATANGQQSTSGGGGGGNSSSHLINAVVRDRSVSPSVNSLMYNTAYRRYRNNEDATTNTTTTSTSTCATTNNSSSSPEVAKSSPSGSAGGGRAGNSGRATAAGDSAATPKLL